ncbi:MAG TPA: hypothetical protein DEB09_03315 [Candidatus Magasanikbacteria bacterium]|nr:hypothetical protein [Candidatus Magasanikbacteria bacterium]
MLSKQIKFNSQNININYRDDSDLSVIDEIFVDKMYRSVENIILNTKHCILDIGAHIGLFSIYASVLNPKIKIIDLEPEPDNFALMKENLKLNHCKNVEAKCLAVIPSECEGSLFKSTDEQLTTNLYLSNNSHNHTTSTGHLTTKPPDHITVTAMTLEKLIGNKKIGLLKMDIEGGEFDIVKNMEYRIWGMIDCIAVEYHENENNKRSDLENIIRSHGFSVEHFPNHYDKRFGLLVCRNKKT